MQKRADCIERNDYLLRKGVHCLERISPSRTTFCDKGATAQNVIARKSYGLQMHSFNLEGNESVQITFREETSFM